MTPQETITDQVIHKTDYLRGRSWGLHDQAFPKNLGMSRSHDRKEGYYGLAFRGTVSGESLPCGASRQGAQEFKDHGVLEWCLLEVFCLSCSSCRLHRTLRQRSWLFAVDVDKNVQRRGFPWMDEEGMEVAWWG